MTMSTLRASASSSSVNPDTAYSLALLSEYTHTLDSLPLDLSRNFADLRELDAVLSSSMAGITTKIIALTEMIENGTGQKEERLWLLTEIAEEAQRLKPGGEDKIRVACQAADNLKGHANHLRALAENVPQFDASTLNRQTTYPHVAQKSFMPLTSAESGRRRRGGYGSLLSATDPSPAKRKRGARDDDMGTPRREKVSESNSRQRNGARAKKTDRAPSPADSVLSVTSHMLPQPQQNANAGSSSRGHSHQGSRAGNGHNGSSSSNKRSRPSAQQRGASPLHNDRFTDVYDQRQANQSNSNSANSRREAFNVPPSSSHPSLPLPYHANGTNGYAQSSAPGLSGVVNDWNSTRNQLEGPGMPVARPFTVIPGASGVLNGAVGNSGAVEAGDGEGDGEGEGDDKPYCYCNRPSFGQMIGCDEPTCRIEWFHVGCIGMVIPPDGTWYCDDCQAQREKKNGRRSGRGGKRKAAGNRSGGRSTSGA